MVTENKEVAASTNYYTIWIDDNIVHGDAETDDENLKKIYKRRATNASVTQTYGSAYSASFTLPCSNYYVDIGRPFISMVLIKEKNNVIFFGRIIEKSYSFDKSVTYECEGAQAFLNDKIYPVFDYSINHEHLNEYLHYGKISTNDLFANIMIHYNENVDNDHKIYYEFSKSKYQTLYNVDIERDTVYNVLKSNCIDIDGGYLVMESDDSGGPIVNKLYWRDYPSTNSADTSVIRYGLNLVDLNQRFDLSQLHTVYCVRFGYDNGERDKDGNIKEEDKENWTYLTYEDENIINKYGLTGEKYIDLDFVERGRKIEDDEVTTKEKLEDDEEYMNRIRETIRIQYESENKNAISINANVVELTPLNVNVSKSSDEVKYATPIKLGEIIKIDSPYHTILDDLPISSIQYDLLSLNKSLTIGALEPSLGKIVAREANFKEEEGGDEKDKEEDNIIVEELNITANGTYTAEENHAYNPVNVNVQTQIIGSPIKIIAEEDISENDPITFTRHMSINLENSKFGILLTTSNPGEKYGNVCRIYTSTSTTYNSNPYPTRYKSATIVNNKYKTKQFLNSMKQSYYYTIPASSVRPPDRMTINDVSGTHISTITNNRLCIFAEYDKKYLICSLADSYKMANYHSSSGLTYLIIQMLFNNGYFYVIDMDSGTEIGLFQDQSIKDIVKIGYASSETPDDNSTSAVMHILNVKDKLWVTQSSYYDLNSKTYITLDDERKTLFPYNMPIILTDDESGYVYSNTSKTNGFGDGEAIYYYNFSSKSTTRLHTIGSSGSGVNDILHPTFYYSQYDSESTLTFSGFRAIFIKNKMYTFVPGGQVNESYPWVPTSLDVKEITQNGFSSITKTYALPITDHCVPHDNTMIDYTIDNDGYIKLALIDKELTSIIIFDEAQGIMTSINVMEYIYQQILNLGITDVKHVTGRIREPNLSLSLCETCISVIVTYGLYYSDDYTENYTKYDNLIDIPIEEVFSVRKAIIGYSNQNISKDSTGEAIILPPRDINIIPQIHVTS